MARRGIFGTIVNCVVWVVVIGFIIAVLQHFNWDFGAAFTWAWETISGAVFKVAQWFTDLPVFQHLFK